MKLPNFSSPLKLFSPAPTQPAFGAAGAGAGGPMMFASGGGGGDYDPDDFDHYEEFDDEPEPPRRRPRATRSTPAGGGRDTTGGRPRTSQFQPEERFWTDYLRIALPVIGLLLLVGLLWFWADRLINDEPGPSEQVATETIGQVVASTPTAPVATEPLVVATPPPGTGTTAGEAATTPPPETQPGGDNQSGSAPEATEPPADETGTGAAFSSGEEVVITEPVNLRPNPTTEGEPIEVLDADSTLTIIGGPEESESYTWWEVATADGTTGWVAEGDYLQPAG